MICPETIPTLPPASAATFGGTDSYSQARAGAAGPGLLSPSAGLVSAESVVEVEADALDGAPQCPAADGATPSEGTGDVAAVASDHATDQSGNRLSGDAHVNPFCASVAVPSDLLTDDASCADGPNTDEWRITEANRRRELVLTYRALLGQGHSGKTAAKLMGENHVNLWRYNKAFEADGFNGLIPHTDRCGRKSEIAKLRELLGSAEVDVILKKIRAINLDVESTTAALRRYAHMNDCPAPLASLILDPNRCSKHALPPSLRLAAQPPRATRLAHRGPRTLSLKGAYTPRMLDILPGDVFSADDTTPIWAWWVPWVESVDYPFGVKLLQGQFIPVIDVASQCIVTFALIAREKSSYRACDIWALFGHTFDTVGVPRLGFQLERGSWEANMIAGQEIEYREDEVTLSRRVGGLRQLPTKITPWHQEKLGDAATYFPKTLQTWTSYLPKSKSVEAWFNRNQSMEGSLWGSLGRDQMRAPYEKAKKLFQQCSRPRAKVDPRQHFLSGVEMANRLRSLIDYVNGEPMEGEVFHGIPRVNFDTTMREHPLDFLPEEQRYLYRRNWSALQITGGYARVRRTHEITGKHYSLWYQNPALFAQIEGAQVIVYYDRENFERPAQILAAQPMMIDGTRRAPGDFLGEADWFERPGMFLSGETNAHELRKQWRQAVTTLYGTLVQHAPSRQLPPEIAARREAAKALQPDGRDAAVRVQATQPATGTRPPATAPALPAPTPDAWKRRTERLAQQSTLARELNALAALQT